MCKPSHHFHFCTFASLRKKPLPVRSGEKADQSEYLKFTFIWTLKKHLGKKDDLTLGEIVMPVESLTEEITAEDLVKQLNSRQLFDFDYSPSEGDNLEISKEYIYCSIQGLERPHLYDYLSFIYRRGKWKIDHYDFFSNKTRQIRKGIVQFE